MGCHRHASSHTEKPENWLSSSQFVGRQVGSQLAETALSQPAGPCPSLAPKLNPGARPGPLATVVATLVEPVDPA